MTATPTGGQALNGKSMVEQHNQYLNRHSVSESLVIPVAKLDLWKEISRPGSLNDTHPFCRSNKAISWNLEEHKDELVYLSGLTFIRQFVTWNEGDGYQLIIGEQDGPQSFVKWDIESLSSTKAKLTITVYPYILARLGKVLSFLPFHIFIKPRLSSYLKSVLRGHSHYLTTGKPVPRNHWGSHPWFS